MPSRRLTTDTTGRESRVSNHAAAPSGRDLLQFLEQVWIAIAMAG
jgi:hypothetical protein